MFEIRTVRCETPVKMATGKYKVDESTTMGRLIKRLFDHGHYGKEEEAVACHVIEEYFEDRETLDSIVIQIERLLMEGRKPVKILIGCADVDELMDQMSDNLYGHMRTPLHYDFGGGRRGRIYGLPFSTVRGMKGVVVLDREMLTVTKEDSRW